jgi:superfamily II DNA or RNA helicase
VGPVGEFTSINKKSQALLRHLIEMPASAVYALAGKGHLFNGFELCKHTPVRELSWLQDGAVLNLRLEWQGSFQVSFSMSQGELSGACDCGVWSPQGRCPHLVASLATLKKALAPSSFPKLQLPADYLERLRRQLSPQLHLDDPLAVAPDQAATPRYALVAERRGDAIKMRLYQDLLPVSLFEPGLAAPLREFLRLMYAPAVGGRSIEEFLARFRGKYPILFAEADALVPLEFDPAGQRSVLVHLDRVRGELQVRQSLEDGTALNEHSLLSESYYFDLRGHRVQRLADPGGQGFYPRLVAGLKDLPDCEPTGEEWGLRVAADDFNRLHIALDEAELERFRKQAHLSVAGEPVQLWQVKPRYRLNILELGDQVQVVAEGVAEQLTFPLAAELFEFFPGEARAHFPQPLKAKKRIQLILETCFAVLDCPSRTERDRIVRLALANPDFVKRGVKSEARRIITSFWEEAHRHRTLLQLTERAWVALGIDGCLQSQLMQIPFRLFGSEIFAGAALPGAFNVERELFLSQLTALREECAAAGFTLALGGEELETVTWSFTLDATRSSIDWFELRPEIRYDGALIDEREFQEAVRGGGLFRSKNGSLVLLDEQSSRALSLFASGGKREVVRVPRLQILDWIALRRSGVRVLLAPEDERIINSLLNFSSIARRGIPAGLRATLRNYQCEGYYWLAFLYEHRFGACLADDMGLGKTIQAIALLGGLAEGLIACDLPQELPHLVVVPPSLIFNWESEIARFYPDFKVGVYRGQGRRMEFAGLDLVITSYGVVQRDIEQLSEIPFNVIVFDEAQAVKNIHAETTGAVRRLKGRFKVTLTGTPVENHLGEYYSVMDLALPGLLGPYEMFRRGMGREGGSFLETLVRRTRPFILRRTKDMIAAELPPKVETDLYLEMSPRQKALYARTVAQVKATVAEAYSSRAPGQARIIALTAILKLRQICLSSRLLLPEGHEAAPKVDFLIEQLQELFDEGHSVLVFSQFTSFLDLVQEAFVAQGIAFFRLDGSTPVSRRKQLVESFQASKEPSVFLLSLKAGGRGLNLTRASYVFHLDPWWNPAVESQASDRAHRIGQLRQVTITRLLMRHTIEEKMMELKKRKLKLYRALLEDAEHDAGGSIGREDFEFLLGG